MANATLTVTQHAVPLGRQLPIGASRVPFTHLTFTAGADKGVAVRNVIVERGGQSVNAVLDSVMMLDENGFLIGFPGFLNADNQVTLTIPLNLGPGESRSVTIAGNRSLWSNASHAGMTVRLSVVGISIEGEDTIQAWLPASGTLHTVNEGIVIGSVVAMRGVYDPGTSWTVNVGTSEYNFSGVRFIAGSAENAILRALTWTQTGSAIPSDLTNVKVYVDGVPYEVIVGQYGRRYTAIFGAGVLIKSGFSVDVYIQGDLVNGARRTVDFDIELRSDIYIVGETSGFGITPPLGWSTFHHADGSVFTSTEDPWYDASQVTITEGELYVLKAESIPDANVNVNVPGQVLGGFTTRVVGEAVVARRLGFNVDLRNEGSNDDVDDLYNVVLVAENGAVVAGPIDGFAADSIYTEGEKDGSLVFNDAIVFPIGTHTFVFKGTVGADLDNNSTIEISTTPYTDFAQVRGLTTNHEVAAQYASSITLGTMTVKGPMLEITFVGGENTVAAGSPQVYSGEYRLDAKKSGEDIRVITLPIEFGDSNDNRGHLSELVQFTLYDASTGTAVATGSRVINPFAAGQYRYTLDGTGFIVPKGTVKTLVQKVDVLATAGAGSYTIKVPTDAGVTYTGAIGVASGQIVYETFHVSEPFTLNVFNNGSVYITREKQPSINEFSLATPDMPFFSFGFRMENEDMWGTPLHFGAWVSPAPLFEEGKGLTAAILVVENEDGTERHGVVGLAILNSVGENGALYDVFVDLSTLDFPFPTGKRYIGRLALGYDDGLQTGHTVETGFLKNPVFIGFNSGVRITPPLPPREELQQIVTIRKVPNSPVGDADGNGVIDGYDVQVIQSAADTTTVSVIDGSVQPIDPERFRRMNTYPDSVIDWRDVVVLRAYLGGLLLTLPFGDASLNWMFTGFDLALYRRAILAVEALSEFQIRAMDFSGDGRPSTFDITLGRRLLLGLGVPPPPPAQPTFAVEAIGLSSAERTLPAGTSAEKLLYKFSVSSTDSTGVGYEVLSGFEFELMHIALQATTDEYALYAYLDSDFSQPDTSFSPLGVVSIGGCAKIVDEKAVFSDADVRLLHLAPTSEFCDKRDYSFPTETTRYFALVATVFDVESGTTDIDVITSELVSVSGLDVNLPVQILESQ